VGAIRRTIQLCSLGLLVSMAAKPAAARAEQQVRTPPSATSAAQHSARKLVQRARELIANAIPEERVIAEQTLIEATRQCRDCVDAYAELGRLWLTEYSLGRAGISALQKSAAMAELVKELEPNSPLGDYLGVEVLLTIGRQNEAFKLYAGAKKEFPLHIETLAFEARLWAEVDPERALSAAQDAISKGYSLQELSPWIGNAIVKSVGEEESAAAIAKFASVYPDRWLWHRAAMSFAASKKWKEARAAFQRAIELGNNLESQLQLAIIEYRDLGMAKEASQRLEHLGRLVQQSKSLGIDSQALVETHTAFAYLNLKDKKMAKIHADRALALSVNNEARVSQIIETFKTEKQLPLIADSLLKTVSNNPLLEDVHLALAIVATESKNYLKTIEHLSSAIALAPDRDDLYSARGHASYLATRYEVALEDYEAAIRQKPDHAPYHYNKACLLSLLGRKSEAYESLKTALFMNEELRTQAVSDSDLENLRLDKEFESRLVQLGLPLNIAGSKKPAAAIEAESKANSTATNIRVRPGKLD
jgi:tetratricopeptide (TPR) repeat protein